MDIKIKPSKLCGEVIVPPSKSFAHRAIICASLSDGKSVIKNVELSDDIKATLNAMKSLGIEYNVEGTNIEINGINYEKKFNIKDKERKIKSIEENLKYNEIMVNNEKINNKKIIVNCNESGSTLRFLIPIVASLGYKCRFEMRGNLGKRPLDIYYNIFEQNNIMYEKGENYLEIEGNLNAGEYEIPGNISSQFITGMIFALSMKKEDSIIKIVNKIESKSYIDITLECLKDFGISVENNEYKTFYIKGNQKYIAREYYIEGDFSQGAFFLCANAMGSSINVIGLKDDSAQGDKVVIDILKRMKKDRLESTIIDASDCPDIIPILSVCAAFADGNTNIVNAKRLRIKECDRLSAIKEELSKLGACIEEKEDSLIIKGSNNHKLRGNCELYSHKDHRICMMLSIASTICEKEIIIKDIECVSKSYPRFFNDFKKLGAKFEVFGGDDFE